MNIFGKLFCVSLMFILCGCQSAFRIVDTVDESKQVSGQNFRIYVKNDTDVPCQFTTRISGESFIQNCRSFTINAGDVSWCDLPEGNYEFEVVEIREDNFKRKKTNYYGWHGNEYEFSIFKFLSSP